ncbi:hypothetical protein [Mesonia sp. HuA40]|uniref:hypothetical protein n=1 Tax=Mesonia sp. HuA40 TaxID=2602761 RepID=UPI0011C97EE0|nr:hypothetical protein [Mesonia sp. HuA40]TXK74333.1 hypothetical protein FT993_02815 [Mesonia sp. HuA40]
MRLTILALALALGLTSCQQNIEYKPLEPANAANREKAKAIIQETFDKTGVALQESAVIKFKHQGEHYMALRNCGMFMYRKQNTQGKDAIEDVLDNQGFERKINKHLEELTSDEVQEAKAELQQRVNWVQFPFGYQERSFYWIGELKTDEANYHKIAIENEGEPQEIWWVNSQDHLIYYVAQANGDTSGRLFKLDPSFTQEGVHLNQVYAYAVPDAVPLRYAADEFVEASQEWKQTDSLKLDQASVLLTSSNCE